MQCAHWGFVHWSYTEEGTGSPMRSICFKTVEGQCGQPLIGKRLGLIELFLAACLLCRRETREENILFAWPHWPLSSKNRQRDLYFLYGPIGLSPRNRRRRIYFCMAALALILFFIFSCLPANFPFFTSGSIDKLVGRGAFIQYLQEVCCQSSLFLLLYDVGLLD